MGFKDYAYERPDMTKIEADFNILLDKFVKADSFEEQDSVMEKINEIRRDFETAASLVQVRHTLDTTDEYYEKQNDYNVLQLSSLINLGIKSMKMTWSFVTKRSKSI